MAKITEARARDLIQRIIVQSLEEAHNPNRVIAMAAALRMVATITGTLFMRRPEFMYAVFAAMGIEDNITEEELDQMIDKFFSEDKMSDG